MFSSQFIFLFCFVGVYVFEDNCPLLTWQVPPYFYGDSRRYLSYQTVGCTELMEYEIMYSCFRFQPITTCNSTSSDPRGNLKNHFSLELNLCGIFIIFWLCFLLTIFFEKGGCPEGSLCYGSPNICVVCTQPPEKPSYQGKNTFVVIENVTQAMLDGIFWTYTDFYNHTGSLKLKIVCLNVLCKI
jgi:hypothetical protein